MAPCDCYTNQSINSIICNENYDNEYVYYLIKNFLPGLKAYNLGTASGREYVSKSNFEKIELVAEQDKEIQKISKWVDKDKSRLYIMVSTQKGRVLTKRITVTSAYIKTNSYIEKEMTKHEYRY